MAFQYRTTYGTAYTTTTTSYQPATTGDATSFEYIFNAADESKKYWYNPSDETYATDFWLRWFYCSDGKSAPNQNRLTLENLVITEEINATVKTGEWNDPTVWSMGVPFRGENIIVNHDLILSDHTVVGEMQIAPGKKLSLAASALLTAEEVVLHDCPTGSSQIGYTAGQLVVNGHIRLNKTLPERSKWYFCSFPFDVLPQGLLNFDQGDESTALPGNHLYIQYYHAAQRASSGTASGNWATLPISTQEIPLFERNKGYMISIDGTSETTTIQLCSVVSPLLSDGQIPITAYLHQNDPQSPHSGWALVGHPLLSTTDTYTPYLSEEAFTPFIYHYDTLQHNYVVYRSDETIALPPYSAYFVKAWKNNTLEWRPAIDARSVATQGDEETIRLTLCGADNPQRKDLLRLIFKTGGDTRFVQQEDAYKWASLDADFPYLSMTASGIETSINTLPKDFSGELP